MKDKKKLFVFIVFFYLVFLLEGCSKDNFIIIDYPNSYYVTENNTKFGYQFAYNKKIDEFEVVAFKTENQKKYSYEFITEVDENGSQMKINNYYVYGIVFDFCFENNYFESFDIKINNKTLKSIDLNMKINANASSENEDILPLSVPYIGDVSKEVEWVILPLTDIKITSISVVDSQNLTYSILINSIKLDSEHSYKAKEKIFIGASFDYDETILFDYMYLSISYVDSNSENKSYNTEVSIFGNSLDALRRKIC